MRLRFHEGEQAREEGDTGLHVPDRELPAQYPLLSDEFDPRRLVFVGTVRVVTLETGPRKASPARVEDAVEVEGSLRADGAMITS